MDSICAMNSCADASMNPVSQAVKKAVDGTMEMEAELMKAGVAAQVGAEELASLEQGAGQLINVWG